MVKKTRRTKGEGSVYFYKKRQTWIAQFGIGVNSEGNRVRRTVSGNSKIDVVKKMKECQKSECFSGINKTSSLKATIGFCDYAKYFLNTFKRPVIRSTTFFRYCNIYKRIEKEFKGFNLNEVDHIKVQNFLNSLAGYGMPQTSLSQSTIKTYGLFFKQIFKQAVLEEYIECNPFDKGIVIPKTKKTNKNIKPIPKKICMQILKASDKSEIFKPLVYILLFTGMRIGEVLALKWENIDEEKGLIYVKGSISRQVIIDNNLDVIGHKNIVSQTKTINSKRQITVEKKVFDVLNEWREYFMQNSVYTDSLYNEYIFLNHEGQLREYKCFRRQFKNFLKEEGLDGEHINFHQFRHTYATLLINNGENPRVVQELLGHKDVRTTLNIYTSVNINTLMKASIKYASIFKEVSE